MAIEIERKFLVNVELIPIGIDGIGIRQGYLLVSPEKSVRVRIAGHKAFITVKGSDHQGSRPEFEYEIPVEDAEFMLANHCQGQKISKIRRHIIHKGHLWEIDEFLEDNKGLWLAEIELSDAGEIIELPSWVTVEVTGDKKYYNSYLSQHPYVST
jgi:adenylate cyclase